ncbi:rRNA maturation RNase YbeY [Synechococcus sp. PCC 7502]|uniref:rRNA maturation RNase YbeY n=1 Tax=Synechococcus sp. PCC 7502 TaxID=1173263 RepID=UPI001FEDBC40|nr:rRNA maturation RNase YbeY [Synechococcus sp. PCC 7502]
MNPEIAQLDALDSIDIQPWQYWFQVWLNLLTPKVEITSTDYEASLLLTDDRSIQALNRQYRFQDRPTDVLAFAALETDVPALAMNLEPVYLGDIVISVPTAINQALERGHSTNWELVWLAAHGFLHLLGWDHPDAESLASMLAEQDLLLEAIAIAKNH